jgi:ABC-2 type transport system ATP-binding protein
MTAAVSATDLSKEYGETLALASVSLRVERGEGFALVGPNGAGKTTLVRLLTGTLEPTAGHARLLEAPPRQAERARLGLLPQDYDPPTRLTVRELLSTAAGRYDRSRPIDEVMADVGLEAAADTRYEALSGGQKRRTCVGIALVNDPAVLFLDEPTTGIDPAGRQALWDLLEDLVASGTTVILTTHDMTEAARLADRVGFLRDGELVSVGTPADLIAAHGGEPVLRVETTEPVAAEALRELPGAVSADGKTLRVEGVEATAIGDVIDAIRNQGVAVDGISWREPTLEDAYLNLTGTAVKKQPAETRVAPHQ